jgi:hypothetical protein
VTWSSLDRLFRLQVQSSTRTRRAASTYEYRGGRRPPSPNRHRRRQTR